MRRPIPKFCAVFIIASFLCVGHGYSQCQFEVQYAAEKTGNSFSLYLKANSALGSLKVQLYDLFQGKIIAEKELRYLGTDPIEVFKDIAPSKYAVLIKSENCEHTKTLGGINGISIGIQD